MAEVMSRYQHLNAGRFPSLLSTASGYGVPFHHGVQAMTSDTGSRALGAGWDEEVANGGEDRDETLQTSRRSETLH